MAMIVPTYPDCVVALGVRDGEASSWVATGFLYGHSVSETQMSVFLITNRHVVEGMEELVVRFNVRPNQTRSVREYFTTIVDDSGVPLWVAPDDETVDVAAIPMNMRTIENDELAFSVFRDDLHVANRKRAAALGIAEGDLIYTLGFPMGMVGTDQNYAIARIGCIARIRDVLHGTSNQFLIDSTVYPGNSGGPVINRAEALAVGGTNPVAASYLLGVVSSYISYQDIAISERTQRPRVTFEENSGLTAVVPIDLIVDPIERWLQRMRKGAKAAKAAFR